VRNVFASDVNNLVDERNVYGAQGGPTTGTRAGAFTPYTAGAPGSEVPASGGGGGMNGFVGKPLSWWFLLAVLLVALMWSAQKFGSLGEDFKSVRLSVYNIVVITLAAMVGIGAFKVIFGKFQVPGLSEYIAAI
jgi:hypothetical protein